MRRAAPCALHARCQPPASSASGLNTTTQVPPSTSQPEQVRTGSSRASSSRVTRSAWRRSTSAATTQTRPVPKRHPRGPPAAPARSQQLSELSRAGMIDSGLQEPLVSNRYQRIENVAARSKRATPSTSLRADLTRPEAGLIAMPYRGGSRVGHARTLGHTWVTRSSSEVQIQQPSSTYGSRGSRLPSRPCRFDPGHPLQGGPGGHRSQVARHRPDARLDGDVPAGSEVAHGIAGALDLPALGPHVAQPVPGHVAQRELPGAALPAMSPVSTGTSPRFLRVAGADGAHRGPSPRSGHHPCHRVRCAQRMATRRTPVR
jgi:hypothetical protein